MAMYDNDNTVEKLFNLDYVDLTRNQKFETIFKNAYGLLNPGGEVVICACYIDNESTRLKQKESYSKMCMSVISM